MKDHTLPFLEPLGSDLTRVLSYVYDGEVGSITLKPCAVMVFFHVADDARYLTLSFTAIGVK